MSRKNQEKIGFQRNLLPDKSKRPIQWIGLNALNIGLPSSVGTSVRMGNLNSKSDTFSADVAFSHVSAPPLC